MSKGKKKRRKHLSRQRMLLLWFILTFFIGMLMGGRITIIPSNEYEPSPISQITPKDKIRFCLNKVGIYGDHAEELSDTVLMVSKRRELPPELLIALSHSESNFKRYAKSPSEVYKGYLQIPYPLYASDENFLVGARLLNEKLAVTKGNLRKAICLYKGWGRTNHPTGLKQADKVIKIYKELMRL